MRLDADAGEEVNAGAPTAVRGDRGSEVISEQQDDEAHDSTTPVSGNVYRVRADGFRENAADARLDGDEGHASWCEFEAAVADSCAHLADLGQSVDEAAVRKAQGAISRSPHDRPALGAFRGPFLSWPKFWAQDHTEQEWVIDRVLARGRGHAIYAAQKVGKSLVTLWAAVSAATGPEPVRVLYLDYEMTEADVFERLSDMGYGAGTDLSRLRYALLPPFAPLDTAQGGADLLRLVDTERHDGEHLVVIIDTYSRAVAGDENDNDTTRAFYRHTGMGLKQRGVTWVRLDHAGKDATKGQRGGSAKGDDVDVVWKLERADDGYTLRRDVARMGWVPERVAIRQHSDPLRFTIGEDALPPGTRDLADVLTELDVPRDATVKVARAALKAAGRTASTAVLTAAVRYRKNGGTRHGTHSDPLGGTPHGTHSDIGHGLGGTRHGTQRNASAVPTERSTTLKGGTFQDQARNITNELGSALDAEVVA